MSIAVIIPAAGCGKRMKGLTIPKQFIEIDGIPMVYHSLKVFAALDNVTQIIVATQKENFSFFNAEVLALHGISKVQVVSGGAERVDSVWNALKKVQQGTEFVMIHDAARPFIHGDDVRRVISAAGKRGSVILARNVIPTVKQVLQDSVISSTIDRTTLRHAETPQMFRYVTIVRAHTTYRKNMRYAPTDDACLVEALGEKVYCVMAKHTNTKITSQSDLETRRKDMTEMNIRVGTGYDIHRLVEGRQLYVGGVKIPFGRGCLGHSDGDPLLHAIIDSLLGAIGSKDIGERFPTTNRKIKGIASIELLKQTKKILDRKKYVVGNIDATVICERPKIADYKKEMAQKIADCLDIDAEQVSIKGKTKEGLDPEGDGLAISVHAVALVMSSAKK